MGTLNELRDECHALAKAKGWWVDERSMGELLTLVNSELAEATEQYRDGHPPHLTYTNASPERKGKPEGVPVEIADAFIRVLDFSGYYNLDLDDTIREITGKDDVIESIKEKNGFEEKGIDGFGEAMMETHHTVSMIYQDYKDGADISVEVAYFLAMCFWFADLFGFDLMENYEKKMNYNHGRERRHGGKVI